VSFFGGGGGCGGGELALVVVGVWWLFNQLRFFGRVGREGGWVLLFSFPAWDDGNGETSYFLLSAERQKNRARQPTCAAGAGGLELLAD